LYGIVQLPGAGVGPTSGCDHESPGLLIGAITAFALAVDADKTKEAGEPVGAAGAAVVVAAAAVGAARPALAVAVLSTPAASPEPGLTPLVLRAATPGVAAGSKNSPLSTALAPDVPVMVMSTLPPTAQSR
jgi:hypothetical protein